MIEKVKKNIVYQVVSEFIRKLISIKDHHSIFGFL